MQLKLSFLCIVSAVAGLCVQLVLPTIWWVVANALTSVVIEPLVGWTPVVRADASAAVGVPHLGGGARLRRTGRDRTCRSFRTAVSSYARTAFPAPLLAAVTSLGNA